MFNKAGLSRLYEKHEITLHKVVDLERALNNRFFGMQDTIECMMLAALTGEAMVMIGPPGTAKSRLVRTFCNLTSLVGDDAMTAPRHGKGQVQKEQKKEEYFEYLLTQFTEPSELFGYFDLGKLFGDEKQFVRDDAGMMQKAQVVFLDEVFNASSAILNSLLTFMNEKKYQDRGIVQKVPMRLLFAASNQPPSELGLAAVYDRFLLRSWLENATPRDTGDLLSKAWNETHNTPKSSDGDVDFSGLLDDLVSYRVTVDELTQNGELSIDKNQVTMARLKDLVETMRKSGASDMSNRRLVKFAGIILANALLRCAREQGKAPSIEAEDLSVIPRFGSNGPNSNLKNKSLLDLKQ